MVLAELGNRIASALGNMSKATVIDQKVFDELVNEVVRALLMSDVNVGLVQKVRENIRKSINLDEMGGINKRRIIQSRLVDELVGLLSTGKEPWKPARGCVVMLIGLQGSGKTTTCVKLAYHYHRKGWRAALVCADTFRAGAFDQLKQNATKAGIAYFGSSTETDPAILAGQGVAKFRAEKFDIIVVDTSGRHKQEDALFDEMLSVHRAVNPDNVVFVIDSSIGQACQPQAQAFMNKVGFSSVIITKLDGHAKGGGALSAVSESNCNILFIGTGERLTDFDTFSAPSFVSKLIGMGDLDGLIRKVNQLENKDITDKLAHGQFTLRDLYEQFQNILKMGSLGDIMASIPGFSMFAKEGEADTAKRFKSCITIMDSMTDKELDAPDAQKLFNKETSRFTRVARGSGRSMLEVQMVFKFYVQFTQMFKKMGGMKNLFTKDGDIRKNANMNQLNQLVRNMGQRMDPRVMQQMGGMSGISNMLRQFQQSAPDGNRRR